MIFSIIFLSKTKFLKYISHLIWNLLYTIELNILIPDVLFQFKITSAHLRLFGGIKRKPRVTSIERAFQMTSQNASLREREQVSLRNDDDRGTDVIISRPLNARSSERASHRIMLLQWSWGAANLRSFPREHMSSRSIHPSVRPSVRSSFLPSFLPSYMLPLIMVADVTHHWFT